MCQLCNGTHVVHEMISFGYRTSCCPVCGPEPADIQKARLERIHARVDKLKKEATTIDQH